MKTEIRIYDNRNELILETNSETYAEDLSNNREKLVQWWSIHIVYENDRMCYSSCHQADARKLACIGDRTVNADYYMSCEGEKQFYDKLIKAFDEDFKGVN